MWDRVGSRLFAVVVMTVVLLVGAGGRAAATEFWSIPEDVPGSAHGSEVLAVVDDRGAVTAVWGTGRDPSPFAAARREPGGPWTPTQPAPDVVGGAWDIGVGPDGVVSVVMTSRTGISVTRLGQDDVWSAPEQVAATRRFGPPLLDATGPAPIVAWVSRETSPRRVLASVRRDDGSWTAPRAVSQVDREVGLRMDLEVSADGTATFVWLQHPPADDRKRVWLRERRPDGSWTPRLPLSPRGAGIPDLSVASDGSAAVGWSLHDGGWVWRPQVAVRTPAGRWRVDLVDEQPRRAFGPTVLALPGGETFAGWTYISEQFGSPDPLWTAVRAASRWLPAERISPRAGRHLDPVFAEWGSRRHVLWSGDVSENSVSVLMNRVWHGTGWTGINVVSSGRFTQDFAVALNPDGEGCVLFMVWDPAGYRVQSSCRLSQP